MFYDDRAVPYQMTAFLTVYFFLLFYRADTAILGWEKTSVGIEYVNALEPFGGQLTLRAKRAEPITLGIVAAAAAGYMCSAGLNFIVGLIKQYRIQNKDWIKSTNEQQYVHMCEWIFQSITYDDHGRIIKLDDFRTVQRNVDTPVRDVRVEEPNRKKVLNSDHKFVKHILSKKAEGEKLSAIEEESYEALETLLVRSYIAEDVINHILQRSVAGWYKEVGKFKNRLLEIKDKLPHKQNWHDVCEVEQLQKRLNPEKINIEQPSIKI
ncbi:hypothetical protein Ddc_15635 [Ditylenchus destructor]|nr:hypothetical protein Ddc_15635 [Ditylenchus destructor]